jgi:hypothetical protein
MEPVLDLRAEQEIVKKSRMHSCLVRTEKHGSLAQGDTDFRRHADDLPHGRLSGENEVAGPGRAPDRPRSIGLVGNPRLF